MSKSLGAEIVKTYLKKYPTTPSLTLAKKIYKENKKQFNTLESVRTSVRTYRGKAGEKKRRVTKDNEFFNQKIQFNLPESHAEHYDPYIISQSKVLILSDLHFPYQDNTAIRAAINYGKEQKVNCILINGDLIDFATISRHEKDWRHRNIAFEFEAVREFLFELRKHFPRTKIVFKEGNHDERWEKWLFLKAPEIFDDPEFKLASRLRLGELHIDVVQDKLPVKIGKLTVLHGHELQGGGGVNPARATFLKTLNSVVIGHVHKTSMHSEARMDGEIINVQSTGCLCGMYPMFARVNKWNQGFCYVEHDIKSGEYKLYNKLIIKGKVY